MSFNTEPTTKNGEGIRDKGHLFITSILQNALSVKTDNEIAKSFQGSAGMDFVANATSVREEMKQAWGEGAEAYIKNLLMSIEGELKTKEKRRQSRRFLIIVR